MREAALYLQTTVTRSFPTLQNEFKAQVNGQQGRLHSDAKASSGGTHCTWIATHRPKKDAENPENRIFVVWVMNHTTSKKFDEDNHLLKIEFQTASNAPPPDSLFHEILRAAYKVFYFENSESAMPYRPVLLGSEWRRSRLMIGRRGCVSSVFT